MDKEAPQKGRCSYFWGITYIAKCLDCTESVVDSDKENLYFKCFSFNHPSGYCDFCGNGHRYIAIPEDKTTIPEKDPTRGPNAVNYYNPVK